MSVLLKAFGVFGRNFMFLFCHIIEYFNNKQNC